MDHPVTTRQRDEVLAAYFNFSLSFPIGKKEEHEPTNHPFSTESNVF
jgi:hypothetical protein